MFSRAALWTRLPRYSGVIPGRRGLLRTQWQDSAPYLWNIDYYDGKGATTILPTDLSKSVTYFENNTFFDLEYCNWNKDMFFGSLPDAQYGDTSVVDISYGTTGAPVRTEQHLQSPLNSNSTIGTTTEFSSQLIEAGTNLTLDVEILS